MAGTTQACLCPTGAMGAQSCQADGTFSACGCESSMVDAGGSARDAGEGVDSGSADVDAGDLDAGSDAGPDPTPEPFPGFCTRVATGEDGSVVRETRTYDGEGRLIEAGDRTWTWGSHGGVERIGNGPDRAAVWTWARATSGTWFVTETGTEFPGGYEANAFFENDGTHVTVQRDRSERLQYGFTWNGAGQLASRTEYSQLNAPDEITDVASYTYDDGRLTGIRGSGYEVTYTYDGAGRLLSRTSTSSSPDRTWELDSQGRPIRLMAGGGSSDYSIEWDADGEGGTLTWESGSGPGTCAEVFEGRYVTTVETGRFEPYSRDGFGAPLGPAEGRVVLPSVEWRLEGRVLQRDCPGSREDFSYDEAGNLLRQERSGDQTFDETVTYTYDCW